MTVLSMTTGGSEARRGGYPVLDLELGRSMAGRAIARRVEPYLGGAEGSRGVEVDEGVQG